MKFFLFADDTNIIFADKTLKTLEITVNTEIKKLNDWLTSNKLTLNTKKSNYVIFRPYQKKIQNIPKIYIFDYDLNRNVNLEYKDSIKCLGVYFDENLWPAVLDKNT